MIGRLTGTSVAARACHLFFVVDGNSLTHHSLARATGEAPMSDSIKALFDHPLCVCGYGWTASVLGCKRSRIMRGYSMIVGYGVECSQNRSHQSINCCHSTTQIHARTHAHALILDQIKSHRPVFLAPNSDTCTDAHAHNYSIQL